jgi:hypothetical protein
MLAADVQRFDDLLAEEAEGLGLWRRDRGVDYSDRLADALAAGGGTQAFLHPLDPDGSPCGPMMQFLIGRVRVVHIDRQYLPDGRVTPVSIDREALHAGWLAYTWTPAEEPPPIQAAFPELARRAFRCLHAVTRPHLALALSGKPVRSYRIGPAAKQWVREDPARGLCDSTRWFELVR